MLTQLIAAIRRYNHGGPLHEWREYHLPGGQPKMRRMRPDGTWEYRPLTPEEAEEYQREMAW